MIYVLSGGTGKAFAVIGVTYPAGSVCTCSDGTKTLSLKDTSGQGFFLIPYAATWTVTATNGTNTKAQSVEITSEGQTESVALSYALDIFNNGVLTYPIEGIKNADTDTASVTISGGKMVWEAVDSGEIGRRFNFTTTDMIDVTDFNTLNIVYTVDDPEPMSSGRNWFGVSTNKKAIMSSTDYGASTTFTTTPAGDYILNVPIDAISGQQYISAYAFISNSGKLVVSVSRLYLE